MGVQREVAGDPGQQMLAVREVIEDRQPGEVRRCVCRHPQLAVGQHALAKGGVEAAGKRVDGVTSGTQPSCLAQIRYRRSTQRRLISAVGFPGPEAPP